jgi:putative ABC transport system permease protein
MNAVLVRTDRGAAQALHDEVKNIPLVGSVELREDALRNLQATLATSMKIMGTSSIIFAAVIAFAIIYNVTMVSLSERERELASLRVLGFTQREVGAILFNENFLTGALGIVLGIPMGMAMVWGMMHAFDMELFRFPFHIEPRTYAISVGLTVFFIAIANLAVRRKIVRLDMVETLKARE